MFQSLRPLWCGRVRDPLEKAYRKLVRLSNRTRRLGELNAPKIIIDNEAAQMQQAFEQLVSVVGRDFGERANRKPLPARGARAKTLLADVYANPSEAGARAVYADHLLELGDPRGEFISLQLARPDGKRMSKREATLLRQGKERWLGELASEIDRAKFRGGFLTSCRVNRNAAIDAEALIWSTVETLETDNHALREGSRMGLLRELHCSFSTLAVLCVDTIPPRSSRRYACESHKLQTVAECCFHERTAKPEESGAQVFNGDRRPQLGLVRRHTLGHTAQTSNPHRPRRRPQRDLGWHLASDNVVTVQGRG